MKKLFIAAFATFTMVSISSVFANKAMIENVPDGLANDTTDTTSTSAPAEPSTSTEEPATSTSEPSTGNSGQWGRRWNVSYGSCGYNENRYHCCKVVKFEGKQDY